VSVKDPFNAELGALEGLVDLSGMRVLEVSCGDGRLTLRYGGQAASVVAVDADAEAIERARAAMPRELSDGVHFEVMDAAALAVPQHEFDLVFFSWSL
jgi:ubiquinone/menaquinone biosynthesis C-methylase UbiE